MKYFTIRKVFMIPSFDLEVKEQEKIDKFLLLLERSGVGEIISQYVNNSTEKGGRPGYNYYNIFATILYGFAFTKCTLRELAEACKYDLRYIYIMEQERPKYTKFCDFINKVIVPNEGKIFAKITNEIALEMGIDFEDGFIDGSKFEANANKYKFVWKPTTFHKRLTNKSNEIIQKYNLIPNYRVEEFIRSNTLTLAIDGLEAKKNTLLEKEYKDTTKALFGLLEKVLEYEEKEEIIGTKRESYYLTDKDATAMALKADYYSGLGSTMHAAYNVQILVIKGIVFSYYVSQSRSDLNDFIDILKVFYRFYGKYPKRICADAGYGSLENYRYLKENNIENYVKYQTWEGNRSARNPECYHLTEDNKITCLNGEIGYEVKLENRHPRKANAVFFRIDGCNDCNWMPFCKKYMPKQDDNFKIFEVLKELEQYKNQSETNLCSPKGIEMRVNRSIQVEGIFGIEKQNYGYTRYRRRGIEKVSTETMLNYLGINVAKLFRFYETGKTNRFWIVPQNIEPEQFKKPSWKKLSKSGRKINEKVKKNMKD